MSATQDFFNKHNGQGLDFDGAFGFQCMDLAEFYNQEVVKAPRLTGNAIDVWTNYPKDYYDQTLNMPDNHPIEGDIVIWGKTIGEFGHIAVATADATSDRFKSFDQNFPIGSTCHFQEHTYNGVLGWLHPKSQQEAALLVTIPQKELDGLREARDKNWNLYQHDEEIIKNLNEIINDKNRTLGEKEKEVGSLTDEVAIAGSRIDSLTTQAKKVPMLEKQLLYAEKARTDCLGAQETQNRQIGQLQKTSYIGASKTTIISHWLKELFNKRG